jgi:ectoine hydroxylase-related dioxygenase (phytanoyl-CoA dioxygenase family)
VLVQPVLQENAEHPQEKKQMVLSEQQLEEFQKYGYTVVPSFYSAEEVELISVWLDGLRDSDGTENDIATYFETSPSSGETVLVRAEHLLGEHSPAITEMLLKVDAMQALGEVLGDAPLLFKEKANYKLPQCRSDLLHQDQAAGWGSYANFFVTMLIAVDENRIDNAAISFRRAEGHKLELLGPEWEVLSEDEPPFQPEQDYKVIEANPGDVVLFDCYVPHGSPANLTDRARRNLYLTFNRKSDGDHRMAYYHDKWENYPPNTRDEARDRSSFRV